METRTTYFFADEQRCRAWDDELLLIHPALATATDTSWRTTPGWYWRTASVDLETGEFTSDEGGPCATEEECRNDAKHYGGVDPQQHGYVVSGSGQSVH